MVDWIALVVSLVAIFLGMLESKRNHAVWISLLACKAHMSMSRKEHGFARFPQLTICVRNKGISLHGLTAHIQFFDDENIGIVSIPLERSKLNGDTDDFAKGMIAEFTLKSYSINENGKEILRKLKNPKGQGAVLCFYSQNYLCRTFKIKEPPTGWRLRWNIFVAHIQLKMSRTYTHKPSGRKGLYTPRFIPVFNPQLAQVMDFLSMLNRENDSVAEPSA